MIVDLNPMRYTHAVELIKWCFERGIDTERCTELVEAFAGKRKHEEVDWVIDIPDQYMTYFLLKWSSQS